MSDVRPTPKTKRPRRNYSDEFKDSAVKLVARGELSIPRVARDLGVSDSLLRLWVDKARAAESGGMSSEERIELARLRKEVRILKEEREILKKAATFFAKESR
jgi:transposase